MGALRIAMLGLLLWRALRLRCLRCGEGKLYQHGYSMYERCQACGWKFEREEGYWTGAMAVNLVVTELLVLVAVLAPAFAHASFVLIVILGVGVAIVAPLLFYWHTKAFWMAIDFMLNPTPLVSATHIMTVDELRSLVSRPAPGASQPLDVDQQQRDIGGSHAGDA
jgi:uncharacterized protein (DUF983 family)